MIEGVEIRDKETDKPVNWAEIFFNLHKHCNLNKWEIWEYTLPQIAELMQCINKYIQFEVEIKMSPFSMFGGVGSEEGQEGTESAGEGDYEEATEDDIMELARILSGA